MTQRRCAPRRKLKGGPFPKGRPTLFCAVAAKMATMALASHLSHFGPTWLWQNANLTLFEMSYRSHSSACASDAIRGSFLTRDVWGRSKTFSAASLKSTDAALDDGERIAVDKSPLHSSYEKGCQEKILLPPPQGRRESGDLHPALPSS